MEDNIGNLERKENKSSDLEGQVSERLRCSEDLLKACEDILKLDPNNGFALHSCIDMLYSLKRYPEALQKCEVYFSAHHRDVSVLQKHANLLYMVGRYEEGINIYKEVLAIEPNNAEILVKYGDGLCFLQRYTEALEIYQSILETDPENINARMGCGIAFYCLNNCLDALISFEVVLAHNPAHLKARDHRLKMLEHLGVGASTYRITQLFPEENKSSQPLLIADFQHHVLDTEHVSFLARHLAKHPTLRYLYVDRSELTDAGIAILAEALSQNFHLTTLTFEGNGLTLASKPFQVQIKAYLHRNYLLSLAPNTPSLKELHDFDFSMLKGDDFHRVLKRHSDMNNWDFSGKGFTSNAVLFQPHYLPYYPALRRLKLSDNHLGDDGARLLASLLTMEKSLLAGLLTLSLANNHIGSQGFWFLGEAIKCQGVVLEMLDLRQNIIQTNESDWREIKSMLLQNKKLEEVMLGGNALPEAIDGSLNKPLSEEKRTNKSLKVPGRKVAFFYSQPITVQSAIDPAKKIYPEWVIALGCHKDNKRISLYLEGMRNSGQRFLYRYALKEGDSAAKVEGYELNVGLFIDARKNYTLYAFTVSKVLGEQLQTQICTQQRLHRVGSLSDFFDLASGTLNHFLWCQTQLHSIGLDVSEAFFHHESDQNAYN